MTRTDPVIDFQWGAGSPAPSVKPDRFRVEWRGTLQPPREGEWTFFLTSDDGAWLQLDGRPRIDNGGHHPMQERSARLRLDEGPHPFHLRFEEAEGDAGVRLEWEGPGQPRQVVPSSAFTTPNGEPGLQGSYHQGAMVCGLSRESGQAALRDLGVRYVVTGLSNHDCLTEELGLSEVYRGEGVRIWELRP